MNTRVLRVLAGMLIVGGFGSVIAAPVDAQVNLSVSPALIELAARPGDTGQQPLTIANDEPAAVTVTVEVTPFPQATDVYSAVDWLSLDTSTVNVPPGTEATVMIDIAVPDDAPSGGALARITVAPQVNAGGSVGIDVSGQIAVVVVFEIDGDEEIRREVSVDRFAPVLEQDGRVGFRGEVANEGNIHVPVTGTMELTMAGQDDPFAALDVDSTSALLPTLTGPIISLGTLPVPTGTELIAHTEIYPGNPEEIDDLEPVVIDSEFTVDPRLAISGSICENLDRGPTITLGLDNTGTIGLAPAIRVTLVDAERTILVSLAPDGVVVAWPREDMAIPFDGLDRLVTGEYLLTIESTIVQGQEPTITSVPFSIGGVGENVAPLCGTDPATFPDE